jgi:hypothetical protein
VDPDAEARKVTITTKCGTQTKRLIVDKLWGAERMVEVLRAAWKPIVEMSMHVTDEKGSPRVWEGVKEDRIYVLAPKEQRKRSPQRGSRLEAQLTERDTGAFFEIGNPKNSKCTDKVLCMDKVLSLSVYAHCVMVAQPLSNVESVTRDGPSQCHPPIHLHWDQSG